MARSRIFDLDFSELKKRPVSNEEIINARRVINGTQDDGLMQVHPLKHTWADEIYNQMVANNWVHTEVSLQKDVEMWHNPHALTEDEKRVYERSLAFASNLDGLQTNNLTVNILRHITSPEVMLAIVRQTYEEALHVKSYAAMVESLALDPERVYGLYRHDQELFEKNKTVLRAVNKIASPTFKTGTFETDQMFLEACVGNIILEGIYFYSAFLNFYILKRQNKMPGSAEMIQFINRDEDMHCKLFIHIVKTIKEEQPELWTSEFQQRIRKNIIDAVKMELNWGLSCIGEGICGLTPSKLEQYLYFIGDVRLKNVGLEPEWKVTNPLGWIDEFTQGSMIEVNFFEGTVREYQTGTLEW